MEGDWTKSVKKTLKAKGKQAGFSVPQREKAFVLGGLKIQPDVVWYKNGRINCIFEIDIFNGGYYQKTIYGSMLSGIVMAKNYKAKFVEIVQNKTQNGKKAVQITKLLKEQFGSSLPDIVVIKVGAHSGNWKEENLHKETTKKLEEFGIIPENCSHRKVKKPYNFIQNPKE